MSDQLSRAIEQVRSEIANYSDVFRQNEYQTVQSLVNPVLNALGWRVNEVARVRQQYRVGRGKVDMALMRDDKPVVLVEAKALGTDFDDAVIDQVSQYCYREGASTALLTNGAEWRVYRPLLMKLTFEQRMLFAIRLDQQDGGKAADKLSLLARNEIDRLEKEDLQVLLDAYWCTYAREELLAPYAVALREALVKWSNKPQGEIPSRTVSSWLRKKMFRDSAPTRRPTERDNEEQPVPMDGYAVIIDGERMAVGKMTEAMQCVANWLVQRGHIEPHECPIPITKSTGRCFIHTEPVHPNGDSFRGAKRLDNGLYLETHAGSPQNMQYAYRLFERYGYSNDILRFAGFSD